MATTFFNANNLYTQNKNLKKEDVSTLIEWVKNQPHLPDINDAQAIVFLYGLQYNLELAKTAVDSYFTVKTKFPDSFLKRNPSNPYFKESSDTCLFTVLSQKSHKGYAVYLAKVVNSDPNHYFVPGLHKIFDVILSLHLYQSGPSDGYILVFDVEGFTSELIAKTDPHSVRIIFYYLQKVAPVKFKQIHMINSVPYFDEAVALVKLFLEKELCDEVYLHKTSAGLYEHIPQSCLPRDYGGSEDSIADLHDGMKKKILENAAFCKYEDGQIVDESKRSNNPPGDIDFLERGLIRNGKFEVE